MVDDKNEQTRLATLAALKILDTKPEAQYDNVTALAAEMFDVPIALVSLVDENRQWFKSNCGLDGVTETARDISFCQHAIKSTNVMVVENAIEDEKYDQNPLVLGEPSIRFYAGAPLITEEGHALGTLCLIDRKPRKFSAQEQALLVRLATTIRDMIVKNTLEHEIIELAKAARKESEISRSIYDASEAVILRLEAVFNEQGIVSDFTLLGANAALELNTGQKLESLIGNKMLDLFPNIKEVGLFALYSKVVKTGKSETVEIEYTDDTISAWFRVKAEPCGVNGLTVASTPISQRKNFEATVKALKAISPLAHSDPTKYLEELLELGRRTFHATDGFVSNIQDKKYLVKAYVGEMEGLAAGVELALPDTICAAVVEEQTALSFDDLQSNETKCHPAVPQNEFASYLGAPIFVDEEFYGTISFVSDVKRSSPFPTTDLELLSIIAASIGHAIESQKAFEKYARLNDELRMVLDNVPARIWYKDNNNKILRANKAAVLSVGLNDPLEVEGVATEDLFPEIAEKYLQDDLSVIESGKPRRNIVESYAPTNGIEGWISTDKIPMIGEDGNTTILAVATDITELKLKEEQLSRLNESLSDFAFVASHDLQAPLRQSAMFSELFADELKEHEIVLPTLAAEYFDEMEDGLRRMRVMVRSLYDMFKLDSEKIKKKITDFEQIVVQARKQVNSEVEAVGANIEIGDFFQHNVNEELLVQVIQNLVVNACKYSMADQLNIKIHSQIDVINRQKCIIVEDNGVGIAEQFQKKIFEPFKRLHHGKTIEGAGIGLALCKKIMALHDGDLYVDSSFKDGAKFVMAFGY
ncbi:GAF domain-containing protein [Hirschia baltica]|uniref:histidine kinase n=1 Tax=Hirschia baltica (strain ATCC 49814 / DSM 5838 / IFAM 1418) TaxID=582402 RepID=C6XJK2_HIRBI|nr:GAF domain-containing protein [Hirschia baltica]ACT59297.1 multi-sensor signal transduction histidine kinase [Hirschia baltica ATCC 49814]